MNYNQITVVFLILGILSCIRKIFLLKNILYNINDRNWDGFHLGYFILSLCMITLIVFEIFTYVGTIKIL